MKDEDLEPFAVADGLLRRIVLRGPSQLTDSERVYLLNRAREHLARVTGGTLDEAGRAMHTAAGYGDFEVRSSDEFAAVVAWGRVLAVMNRRELRGVCHPESN